MKTLLQPLLCLLLLITASCADDPNGQPQDNPDAPQEDCGDCPEGEFCVQEDDQSPMCAVIDLEGGAPCLEDDDCPLGQGCLDLGNNVRACQLRCDLDALVCTAGCTSIDDRKFCMCNPFADFGESRCGEAFCVNGKEEPTTFCGPCRASGGLVSSTITDQCCAPGDSSECREIYKREGLTEAANLASCLVEEGSPVGVCGLSGEIGVDIECIVDRDCTVGERCVTEFAEGCDEAGFETDGRCLVCR